MSDSHRYSPQRYNRTAQFLHWLIAGLIFCQFVLGSMAEEAAESNRIVAQLALLANHKSVGMTIFILAIVRLTWRLRFPPPALPDTMVGWQVTSAKAAHVAIYTLIFLLPLSGWLMSSASAYSVSWFNLFTFPDLIPPDPELESGLKEIHHILGWVLFVVVMLHILAALKHHFFDKDNVAMRMTSGLGLALFAIVFASGVWALTSQTGGERVASSGSGSGSGNSSGDGKAASAPQPSAAPIPLVADHKLPTDAPAAWQIDQAASHIRFTAEQAGAEFEGVWSHWSADIRFDPAAIETSVATVTVQIDSVSTQDADRDATLMDIDWFHSEQFPTATFRTTTFQTSESGFIAKGELTIKSTSVPIEFAFTLDNIAVDDRPVEDRAARWTLDGKARLDRLAHELGLGDWQDTTWVGQFVTVDVHVEATR